jgi:SAM-dependent methyltransferase
VNRESIGSLSGSMNAYSPKEYWTEVAENFSSADSTGFAPVLHPGAPDWFNRTIDELQFRAVRRALGCARLASGARILDVGCGTGRWLRRYVEMGYRAAGVDATAAMLSTARRQETNAPLICGMVQRLPFADQTFDCVSDITVIQHLPLALQPAAIAEMIRVLKPQGKLILIELIRGKGAHIFARPPEDWIRQVTAHGAQLVHWFGEEFLLIDRLFTVTAQWIGRGRGNHQDDQQPLPAKSAAQAHTSARRLYWKLRHVTLPLSAQLDSVTEMICPRGLATHGVFIFQK